MRDSQKLKKETAKIFQTLNFKEFPSLIPSYMITSFKYSKERTILVLIGDRNSGKSSLCYWLQNHGYSSEYIQTKYDTTYSITGSQLYQRNIYHGIEPLSHHTSTSEASIYHDHGDSISIKPHLNNVFFPSDDESSILSASTTFDTSQSSTSIYSQGHADMSVPTMNIHPSEIIIHGSLSSSPQSPCTQPKAIKYNYSLPNWTHLKIDILDTSSSIERDPLHQVSSWLDFGHLFILCFNLGDYNTFDHIQTLYNLLLRCTKSYKVGKKKSKSPIHHHYLNESDTNTTGSSKHSVDDFFRCVLVGTHSDLVDRRQVLETDAHLLAFSYHSPYLEISSRTGNNVLQAFHTLLTLPTLNQNISSHPYAKISQATTSNRLIKNQATSMISKNSVTSKPSPLDPAQLSKNSYVYDPNSFLSDSIVFEGLTTIQGKLHFLCLVDHYLVIYKIKRKKTQDPSHHHHLQDYIFFDKLDILTTTMVRDAPNKITIQKDPKTSYHLKFSDYNIANQWCIKLSQQQTSLTNPNSNQIKELNYMPLSSYCSLYEFLEANPSLGFHFPKSIKISKKNSQSLFQDQIASKSNTYGFRGKKVVHQLFSIESNNICVDCGSPDPCWVAIDYGILICLPCSRIHRELSSSHAQSLRPLTVDFNWDFLLLNMVQHLGNAFFNRIWEELLNQNLNNIDIYKGVIPKSPENAAMKENVYDSYNSEIHYSPHHGHPSSKMPLPFSKPLPDASFSAKKRFIMQKYTSQIFIPPERRLNISSNQWSSLEYEQIQEVLLSEKHFPSLAKAIFLGLSPNMICDNRGKRFLHVVAEHGNIISLLFLLENGADWKLADGNGRTALDYLSNFYHSDAIDWQKLVPYGEIHAGQDAPADVLKSKTGPRSQMTNSLPKSSALKFHNGTESQMTQQDEESNTSKCGGKIYADLVIDRMVTTHTHFNAQDHHCGDIYPDRTEYSRPSHSCCEDNMTEDLGSAGHAYNHFSENIQTKSSLIEKLNSRVIHTKNSIEECSIFHQNHDYYHVDGFSKGDQQYVEALDSNLQLVSDTSHLQPLHPFSSIEELNHSNELYNGQDYHLNSSNNHDRTMQMMRHPSKRISPCHDQPIQPIPGKESAIQSMSHHDLFSSNDRYGDPQSHINPYNFSKALSNNKYIQFGKKSIQNVDISAQFVSSSHEDDQSVIPDAIYPYNCNIDSLFLENDYPSVTKEILTRGASTDEKHLKIWGSTQQMSTEMKSRLITATLSSLDVKDNVVHPYPSNAVDQSSWSTTQSSNPHWNSMDNSGPKLIPSSNSLNSPMPRPNLVSRKEYHFSKSPIGQRKVSSQKSNIEYQMSLGGLDSNHVSIDEDEQIEPISNLNDLQLLKITPDTSSSWLIPPLPTSCHFQEDSRENNDSNEDSSIKLYRASTKSPIIYPSPPNKSMGSSICKKENQSYIDSNELTPHSINEKRNEINPKSSNQKSVHSPRLLSSPSKNLSSHLHPNDPTSPLSRKNPSQYIQPNQLQENLKSSSFGRKSHGAYVSLSYKLDYNEEIDRSNHFHHARNSPSIDSFHPSHDDDLNPTIPTQIQPWVSTKSIETSFSPTSSKNLDYTEVIENSYYQDEATKSLTFSTNSRNDWNHSSNQNRVSPVLPDPYPTKVHGHPLERHLPFSNFHSTESKSNQHHHHDPQWKPIPKSNFSDQETNEKASNMPSDHRLISIHLISKDQDQASIPSLTHSIHDSMSIKTENIHWPSHGKHDLSVKTSVDRRGYNIKAKGKLGSSISPPSPSLSHSPSSLSLSSSSNISNFSPTASPTKHTYEYLNSNSGIPTHIQVVNKNATPKEQHQYLLTESDRIYDSRYEPPLLSPSSKTTTTIIKKIPCSYPLDTPVRRTNSPGNPGKKSSQLSSHHPP